jgi:hypothetical protein
MPALSEPTVLNRSAANTVAQALARAVRPTSLAASARAEQRQELQRSSSSRAFSSSMQGVGALASLEGCMRIGRAQRHSSLQGSGTSLALRRCVRPRVAGRAGTSFARAGGFGLLASSATQRTMRAGLELLSPRSNPSFEGTPNGAPQFKR